MNIDDHVSQLIDRLDRGFKDKKVLVVDDSIVARRQIEQVLEDIGDGTLFKKDGGEAINELSKWSDQGRVSDWLAMVNHRLKTLA